MSSATARHSGRHDYSYVYKHATLAAIADTLDNVLESVEDLIGRLAHARLLQSGVVDDTRNGLALERDVFLRADAIHSGMKPDPHRRLILEPHGRTGPGDAVNFGVVPRNAGSL